MRNDEFLNVKKILNTKDIKGERCYIHILRGNRSCGKTFNILKLFIERFLSRKEQFCLLYRTKNECKNAHLILSDILDLYFSDYVAFKTIEIVENVIFSIQIENIKTKEVLEVGFAISFYDVDKIKKYSAIFKKVNYLFFDEFELENHRYFKNEFEKFTSIIFSISRGGGQVIRNITILLAANNCDVYNPYFIGFKILDKLNKIENNILRLDGIVLHIIENEVVKKEMKNNKMLSAFKDNNYLKYAIDNTALKDRETFLVSKNYISKNHCNFVTTILNNNDYYSIWLDINNKCMIFSDIKMENSKIVFTITENEKIPSTKDSTFNGLKKLIRDYANKNAIYYTSIKCIEIIENIL